MSTPNAGQNVRSFFGASEVQPKTQLAVVVTVEGVQIPANVNPESDYDVLDVVVDLAMGSTVSGGKLFPRFYYRPEQFLDPKFPAEYLRYDLHPDLGETRPGKKNPVGETFYNMYQMHMIPVISRPERGPRAGQEVADKVTTLMAIGGGTIAGLDALLTAFQKRKEAGGFDASPAQVAEVINGFLKAREHKPRLLVVARQSTNANGSLMDRYELGQWVGPLTQPEYEAMVKRAKASEKKEISRQVKIAFNPAAAK